MKKTNAPKAKTSKLDKVNLTKATMDAQKERATKYQYPAEVVSKEDRKRFRRNARKTKAELAEAIKELSAKKGDKKELEKATAQLVKFEKSTYKPQETVKAVKTAEAVTA